MMKPKIINFFSYWINKVEPEYTFRLVEIIYSEKHGHELCVMQIAGKNIFPKFTPEELLSNRAALVGLNPTDSLAISELSHRIKDRKRHSQILEVDKNGTILLRDSCGRVIRYAEKYLSSNRELLDTFKGSDGHDIGYRVGVRETLEVKKFKKQAIANLFKNKLRKIIPYLKPIN